MERPLWDRIQEIYFSTLPIGEAERRAFVEVACDSDPFLVREVTSLLEADQASGDFLEAPIFELGLRIFSGSDHNKAEESASLADPLIGSTIDGRYLVEKEIGRGGMGAVYLARDLTLHNRPIVIKTLLRPSLHKALVVRRFKQEVEALARIDHPGVVSVLGAGELADGKLYIGMQYVNGVTLRSQIPSEGMNFERAASILKQVGEALDDVHEKGIFHRDLKPENIMLQILKSGAELVKIVDFGIAKVKDSVVAPSTVNEAQVGTVLYMSPEQLRGQKVAAMSDVYSMAVIAYEMVTGRRPFNPSSGPHLLEMHRAGVRVSPIDLRSSLSTEAQAIILRALSFDPKDRYQGAGDFGDALACALSDEDSVERSDREIRKPSPGEGGKQTDSHTRPVTDPPASHPSPATIDTKSRSNSVVPTDGGNRRSQPRSFWFWVLGGPLVALACVAALLSVYKFSGSNQPPKPASGPHRTITYWLTVQKMRDGKPYEDSFESSGQEIFERGYKFRLNVSSRQAGFLYVFNEGAPEKDKTNFTIIYPTPATNDGSARLEQNGDMQTNWNTFGGETGTEHFWVVWSETAITQLEIARHEAFKNKEGAITDSVVDNVRNFLIQHSDPRPETTKDTAKQRTNVRANGDLLIKLVELEHR